MTCLLKGTFAYATTANKRTENSGTAIPATVQAKLSLRICVVSFRLFQCMLWIILLQLA
jgi:hypothetical protein